MNRATSKKIFAGILSTVLLCSAIPTISTTQFLGDSPAFSVNAAEESTKLIYSTDFEDGDTSKFTGRGGVEVISATTEQAKSGSKSMKVTGRTKNWNGPQFLLDGILTPGEQYTVSLSAKTSWYNNITVSLEYTDSSGERKYPTLASATCDGSGWCDFSNIKFSMPEDVTKVYVYVQCNDQADIYVDDFEIRTAPVYSIEQDITSLKDAYSKYFKIGTAVTTDELAPKSTKDLILKHFNSVTLGNELKPDAILDKNATLATGSETNPQVNIASARSILNFCRDNNIPVRGHVLVWHSQTPDWFFKEGYSETGNWVTKEVMLQRMENYIKNVMEAIEKEYPTVDFYAWDVVNETWLDDGSPRKGGTQAENPNYSGWVKIFGDNSFIEPAFEYARKYAPKGCKLYYNDFNEYMPQKTDAIYNMAMELKEKGLIDGIGMQSHLDVSFPKVSYANNTPSYAKALDKFASTGLDIQITELDITTSDISESGFEKQAQVYSDIMDLCVKYADNISSVVFWGTTDDKSWRSAKYPLLFNEDYTAKPAFYSIVDGLESVTTTTTTTSTTTTTTTTEPSLPDIYGDINGDHKVDSEDALLLQKFILGEITFSKEESKRADLTEDGNINVYDLSLLKHRIHLPAPRS